MKITKTILCSFLFFAITTNSNAQFWKKLKKKVQNKVEQKIDKETDKAIDNTLNGKIEKEEPKIVQSVKMPELSGGSSVLKLYNYGFEYVSKDVAISVYGKFSKTNLSNAVKTYNSDKIIAPVDAFPKGYALAYNGAGYLNTKEGQIVIHHADSTKIVFSIKGTWNTQASISNNSISGSYVNLNVSDIIDKRFRNSSDIKDKKTATSNTINKKKTSISKNNNDNNSSILIPNTFSFSSSLDVQITSNDDTKANLEFLLGNYSNIYAMAISSADMGEEGKVFNVVTPKSITMFMDVGGMKIKKTVAQEQFSQADFSDKVPTNANDLQKTGATKSILGFTCYEYKYTNEGGFISIWATKDFPAKNTNISMLAMGDKSLVEGFVLEIDSKSGNEKTNVKAVKYNSSKNVTINTSEYKSMGF